MRQRIRAFCYSVVESRDQTPLVAGLILLTLLAVPWLKLPYGRLDWVALGQPYETSTPAPATMEMTAPTPTSTATAPPAQAPASGATASSSVANDKLTARVYIDQACEGSFQNGFDAPLGSVAVELGLPDGTTQTRRTTSLGMVYFAGIDLSEGATVTVAVPERYRGSYLSPCNPTTAYLPPGGSSPNHIRHEHLEFRMHRSVNPWPFGANLRPSTSIKQVVPESSLLNQDLVGERPAAEAGSALLLPEVAVETAAPAVPGPTHTPHPMYTPEPAKGVTSTEAIATQAPPKVHLPTPSTVSRSFPTSSHVGVHAGLGVSWVAIQELFEQVDETFELESVYFTDGGPPRATGELEEGSVLVELVGPPGNLVSASITARMPSDSPGTAHRRTDHMLALLNLIAPGWQEGPGWLVTNLPVAAQQGEVKTTYGGLQIVLQHIEWFGVTALTIEELH